MKTNKSYMITKKYKIKGKGKRIVGFILQYPGEKRIQTFKTRIASKNVKLIAIALILMLLGSFSFQYVY